MKGVNMTSINRLQRLLPVLDVHYEPVLPNTDVFRGIAEVFLVASCNILVACKW